MVSYTYYGPDGMVVPEMTAQHGEGTLVLQPGNDYQFGDDVAPPGDPLWWAAKATPPPALPVSAPASIAAAPKEG